MLKLNLGSGVKRIEGFLNVDASAECKPDVLMDMESIPWPFEDSSVSHVLLSHVLEHVGRTSQNFLSIMKELYRICADRALIEIAVPHPSHDTFLGDPTHVRPITATTLALFDKELNLQWRERGIANTPLALQCGVNFKIVKAESKMDTAAVPKMKALREKDPMLADMFATYGRNVWRESIIHVIALK